MKKILLLALFGFIVWKGVAYLGHGSAPAPMPTAAPSNAVAPAAASAASAFRCDGRQHCSQMTSRAEAEYFIRHCPDTKMDGDDDGIPCENDSRF